MIKDKLARFKVPKHVLFTESAAVSAAASAIGNTTFAALKKARRSGLTCYRPVVAGGSISTVAITWPSSAASSRHC